MRGHAISCHGWHAKRSSEGVENSSLGRLVNDFYCTEAKDMHYKELADRVRLFKETKEGADSMSNILEEMKNEARIEAEHNKACEIALKMIAEGYSIEQISKLTELPAEKIRELKGEKSA